MPRYLDIGLLFEMLNHLWIQLLILSVFLCALQGYKFLLAPKLRVSSRRGVFRGLSSSLRDEGFHQEKKRDEIKEKIKQLEATGSEDEIMSLLAELKKGG